MMPPPPSSFEGELDEKCAARRRRGEGVAVGVGVGGVGINLGPR